MVNLAGALSSFSQAALKNIQALSTIQESVPNPRSAVSKNVADAATKTVTADPLWAPVPGAMGEANKRFLDNITKPPSFSQALQSVSLGSLLGTGQTSGSAVDSFLGSNVRLEDLVPAQQLYQTISSLGVSSIYADPLQAYAQVNTATEDLNLICEEAKEIILSIQADLANLVNIHGLMNHAAAPSMNLTFFALVKTKASSLLSVCALLRVTLNERGRFDSAQTAAFCAIIDEITNLLSFASSKYLEFEELRRSLVERLNRLVLLGRQVVQILKDIAGFIPAYIASTLFGRVFQVFQGRAVDQSCHDLEEIFRDLDAFSKESGSDKSKLDTAFDIVAKLQAIKAFICNLDPSNDVQDPSGEFAPLKLGYDTLVSNLKLNDPTELFAQLEAQVEIFLRTANTASTRNNSAELSNAVFLLGAVLTPLVLFMTNTCGIADAFNSLFKDQTVGLEDRLQGADELFSGSGLNAAREKLLTRNFDEFAVTPLSQATKPGELAEGIAERVALLPDGHEKDQLIKLHAKIYAIHRSTLLAMDFERREEQETFFSLDKEERDRKLAEDVIKTFSGLQENEFDALDFLS